MGDWLIPIGALVGLVLAVRAQRKRIGELAALAQAVLDDARVQEIRRLLEDRRYYRGELHGVELRVDPLVDGGWWLTWHGRGLAADGLVPTDEQLDQELLRWLRGEQSR